MKEKESSQMYLFCAIIPDVFFALTEGPLKSRTNLLVGEKRFDLFRNFSITSSGFLSSLLALSLIQIEIEVNRRFVICGYNPFEILLSNLLAVSVLICTIALYVGILVSRFLAISHFFPFIAGLILIGFVYGCYGLATGSLIRGKPEGIFFIVMLAKIDAGWLQNPMYYAEAHNNIIIRYLSAYFPSLSAIIAAFTDYSAAPARFYSILYGTGYLILALLIYYNKMRIRK